MITRLIGGVYTSFLIPPGAGFSNFFSEGPDETPVQPERARTVFGGGGGGKNMCAKSLAAGFFFFEALGLLMLSDAISALFWTIYNLFETFFYYTHSNILCIIFYTIVIIL